MDKYIYDESNGLWYELQGEYYLPCLTLPPEEEKPIGIWGQWQTQYLFCRDRQAQERFERLIEQMKQAQGITEQLKAEIALEWTGRMNNIRACAMEIVEKEIIFA